MTITAYFDESGINADQPVCLIAGLVEGPGDSEKFKALAVDWSAVLKKFGLRRFHATDCNAQTGEFKGWELGTSRLAFIEFSQVICKHKPLIMTSVIEREVWNNAGSRTKAEFRFPYHMCFDHCMQILARWTTAEMNAEPIQLVFGEQHQYQSKARKHYVMYRNSSPWGPLLQGVAFARMDSHLALQAADLLAYEVYRWQKAKLLGHFNDKHRPAMQLMIDAGVASIGADYDGRVYPAVLREQAEQAELRRIAMKRTRQNRAGA